MNFTEGEVLLFNKPYRWTSFDVVNKVRNILRKLPALEGEKKRFKVGHAGTLDPLATGLLILCTGKMTKKIQEFQAQKKEYAGTMLLGSTTPSYDLETEINESFSTDHINEKLINDTAMKFTGEITQFPPQHSAKWAGGERAYKKARRGETAELKPSVVNIFEFEITNISMPRVDFRVLCSKGTYIRSLVHDFGKSLNSGAHLGALCRTKIGEHTIEESREIADFVEMMKKI